MSLPRILLATVCAAVLLPLGGAGAAPAASRIIVSTTLNDSLHFIDAETLAETQPPLVSRGGGPVRLWVQDVPMVGSVAPAPILLTANHGVATGSLGLFDLRGDLVTELGLSPIPARAGSVGVTAGRVQLDGRQTTMAFVTNTWFALGGCGMPAGSVTAYDLTPFDRLISPVETGTVELGAPIPYAVALADGERRAFVSLNCGDAVTSIDIAGDGTIAAGTSRPTGDGPDGLLWDDDIGLLFTVDIGGSSISVHDAASAGVATTVPLASSARPIEVAFADLDGRSYALTANGGDHTVTIVDRAVVAACVDAALATCPDAVVTTAPTLPGGAPEGIAYDPVSARVFVVNKPIGAPSLSVLQLGHGPDGAPTLSPVATVGLGALGQTAPQVPSIIAFDVAVQVR